MTQEKVNSTKDLTVDDAVSIVTWLLAGEPSGRPGGHPEFNKLAPQIPALITHLGIRLGIYENIFQKLFAQLNNTELELALCTRGRLLPALFDTNKLIARLSEYSIIETLHGLSLKDDTRYDVLSVTVDRQAEFDPVDLMTQFMEKMKNLADTLGAKPQPGAGQDTDVVDIPEPEMFRTDLLRDRTQWFVRRQWMDWYCITNRATFSQALEAATQARLYQLFPDGDVPPDVNINLAVGDEPELVITKNVVTQTYL